MAHSRLEEVEGAVAGGQLVDCVEIYMPKSIELLAELYHFLREKVTNRFGEVVLDGFSVYEVDGLFRGQQLWEQRTLVIRLMFLRPPGRNISAVEMRVTLLGREIAANVAKNEEEIWICHYPQVLRVFHGVKRLLS
jgi:hypothetical protein